MTEPGKNAPGLTGFPTPNEAAETAAYLLLYFQDETWAQYALGALKALTVGYNWYKSGDLDVDEAAEAFRLIVQQAPLNKLPSCSLPTGQPLMRIDPTNGHIQGVDEDGNWQDDPTLPPPPARTDPTDQEKRCLGSANTANALKILYESLTDSWSMGLSTAEAITAFVAAVGTTLSAAFFPPAAALIAIGGLLFEVVYAVVEFVGADVWSDGFDARLLCILYACSSVDADVVSYDFQCVIDRLAAQTDVLDLSLAELRLFGQLYYILNFIGSEGLNYSSGATAITEATCLCAWSHEFDFSVDEQGWYATDWLDGFPCGTYVAACCWQGTLDHAGGHQVLALAIDITVAPGSQVTDLGGSGEFSSFTAVLWDGTYSTGFPCTITNTVSPGTYTLTVYVNSFTPTIVRWYSITLAGYGDNPFE